MKCRFDAIVAILLIACLGGCTSQFTPSTRGKKIIAYGADWPNTAYVRQNIAQMESLPFDGIIIGVSKSRQSEQHKDTVGISLFDRSALVPADYEHAIADLQATHFKKFTANFIQVETMAGYVDWTDDAHWAIINHNIAAMARVAKQGGCVGLMIDPEEYNGPLWTYSKWDDSRKHSKTQDEFIAIAKQRGQQFMRAINAEYPHIKILFFLGPAFTYSHTRNNNDRYRLLSPFIEGMCTAADKGSTIIDGYEPSYGYRVRPAFAAARAEMQASRQLFDDKPAFDRVMRKGLGICIESDAGKAHGGKDELPRMDSTAEAKQSGVHYALSYSDEYVWTWHSTFNSWVGETPAGEPSYMHDIELGRKSAPKISFAKMSPGDPRLKSIYRADQEHDPKADAEVAKLLATKHILLDLPNTGWQFRIDPDEVGLKSDAPWSQIEVGKFIEEQGWDYDGYAWYRRSFHIHSLPKDKPIELLFEAADESVDVYVNGIKAGSRDDGEGGWNKPFTIDITRAIHSGDNDLTIRLLDRAAPGGLWKPIKLVTPR